MSWLDMGPDEERDCEQAVLKLLQLGLALNRAVSQHDRKALRPLIDQANQQLQVLLCAAGTK